MKYLYAWTAVWFALAGVPMIWAFRPGLDPLGAVTGLCLGMAFAPWEALRLYTRSRSRGGYGLRR